MDADPMTERDEMVALADLRAANAVRQKEWDTLDQLTLAYRGNELAGEVGEACNVIKKLERERLGIAGSRDTVAHLAEELADVIIYTDLIAMQAGIDLDAAVVSKFNASSEKVGLKTKLAFRSAARTDAGNDAWLREQATALWAKLCTDCVHSRTEKCDCLDDILAAFSEIAALPAPAVPQLEHWRDELSEIIGHLGSAITQSVASDDQIIMDHVKSAHEIAKIVRRKA